MASSSRDALARISGPDSMAKPGSAPSHTTEVPLKKKKKHRAGRKRRNRRQSFAAPSEAPTEESAAVEAAAAGERPSLLEAQRASAQQASFYRLHGNRSNTSLESDALLDHRDHGPARSRRDTIKSGFARVALPFSARHGSTPHRSSDASGVLRSSVLPQSAGRSRTQGTALVISEDEEDYDANDKTPLLGRSTRTLRPEPSRHNSVTGYGSRGGHGRKTSRSSRGSSRPRGLEVLTHARNNLLEETHDVNNPPSMPGSPVVGVIEDPFMAGLGSMGSDRGRDTLISIDGDSTNSRRASRRRPTVAELAERDVCFPADGDDVSEACEDEPHHKYQRSTSRRRRRHARAWPDLDVLEEWSREEKEERTHQDLLRAKKISEPVMVDGRLRPAKTAWHRGEEDEPFRFTYFNETLDGTIHARTIADLQDDMTFKELFLPDPVELSDSSDDDDTEEDSIMRPSLQAHHRASSDSRVPKADTTSTNGDIPLSIRAGSIAGTTKNESAPVSGRETPKATSSRPRIHHGPRPTFWLDVLKPTETEMKVLSKAFGIHQLTAEDILMDEPREKVELFKSYYFVNYRTFEQDKDSEDYMEPINMYVIVFQDGVISFHHSMSPHPANVRRRIRQLNDYMSPTADWVSYAIIDDITDVYGPLVSEIEQEVDIIDEDILYMHTTAADAADQTGVKQKPVPKQIKDSKMGSAGKPERPNSAAKKEDQEDKPPESGGDLLRRVGESRKKVMGLYRLLGNKADVIKGFAKRCNEHWEVAPRSEIGLYLGDIQDHIVTMTGNLAHYES